MSTQPPLWEYFVCDYHHLEAEAKASAEARNKDLGEHPSHFDAIEGGMNSLGQEGWELVAVQGSDDALYIFKRPKALSED